MTVSLTRQSSKARRMPGSFGLGEEYSPQQLQNIRTDVRGCSIGRWAPYLYDNVVFSIALTLQFDFGKCPFKCWRVSVERKDGVDYLPAIVINMH